MSTRTQELGHHGDTTKRPQGHSDVATVKTWPPRGSMVTLRTTRTPRPWWWPLWRTSPGGEVPPPCLGHQGHGHHRHSGLANATARATTPIKSSSGFIGWPATLGPTTHLKSSVDLLKTPPKDPSIHLRMR